MRASRRGGVGLDRLQLVRRAVHRRREHARAGPGHADPHRLPPPASEVETTFVAALEASRAGVSRTRSSSSSTRTTRSFSGSRSDAGRLVEGDRRPERGRVHEPDRRHRDHGDVLRGGRLTGSAGCNTYNATFTIDGGAIEITPPATTRKICPEPEGVMEQETAYLAALASARATASTARRCSSSRPDGTRARRLHAREADGHPSAGGRRSRFVSPRRFFSASRRSREAAVGLVGLRRRGTKSAARSFSTSRSTASSRFRAWLRSSWATARSTGPTRPTTRRFCTSVSAEDASTSSSASTLVDDFCACCPPGPLDRETLSSISETGNETERVT